MASAGKVFIIPGNVPSSKNSKRIVRSGSRTYLVDSDVTYKWKKETKSDWIEKSSDFREAVKDYKKPIHVGFYFVRSSNRKFDLVNMAQAPLDAMSNHKWIEDDNATQIVPHFLGYHVDKDNPCLVVVILNQDLATRNFEFVGEKVREVLAEDLGTLF